MFLCNDGVNLGQPILVDPRGIKKFFEQIYAGMNWGKVFKTQHGHSLVVSIGTVFYQTVRIGYCRMRGSGVRMVSERSMA